MTLKRRIAFNLERYMRFLRYNLDWAESFFWQVRDLPEAIAIKEYLSGGTYYQYESEVSQLNLFKESPDDIRYPSGRNYNHYQGNF